MKHYYKTKFILLFLALISLNLGAQMSGLYTINSGSPASVSNFTCFSDFANSLNSNGVSGPVTANVAASSGPYIEQVQFNQITGASATNSIVINANNVILTFSASFIAQPWGVNLNGTDFFTINNLVINGLGTIAYDLVLNGGADNNNFNGCTFNVPANTASSFHIPVVISGTNTNYSTVNNSGNNNTFTNCKMNSGYFGASLYGLTSSPYNGNNKFVGCNFTDNYIYGVYSYYQRQLTMKGCVIECPTRITLSSFFGLYAYYNQGNMIDGNRFKNFFTGSPGFNSSFYGIYHYYNTATGTGTVQNTIQNNIFSGIRNNGPQFCIYSYYMNGSIYHNTMVMDYTAFNNGSAIYGLYGYAGSSPYPLDVKNNLLYQTMGGTGVKYGFFYPTSSGLTSDYNCFYQNNLSGSTFTSNATYSGAEANSVTYNPLFTNLSGGNFLPTSVPLNNLATPVGVTLDINNFTRGNPPDIGALEFNGVVPCTGVPAANSIVTPTYAPCMGNTVPLSLTNSYSVGGITVQWQSSTVSAVGPFSAINGATAQAIISGSLNQSTWYNAVITCANSGSSTTTQAVQVQLAANTTSTVPCYESFEGISANDKLPNCSWAASNMSTTCLTYTASQTLNRIPNTGTKFASFYYNPGGINYFYTNGVYLNSGTTYSIGLKYTTESNGYTNWTDLSILLGTTQSPTGLVSLVSTNGPASSPVYTSLSNTFTVANSGLYYAAIRATANTSSSAQYLSWDDFFITIPCSANSPTVNINSSVSSICGGQSVTLTASGASSYTWSNGSTANSIVVSPTVTSSYSLIGINTGCQGNSAVTISVGVAPALSVSSSVSNFSVCLGKQAILSASGNYGSFTWSNPVQTGAIVAVTPTANTVYTVVASGGNSGCTKTKTISVSVAPNPVSVVSVTNSGCGTVCLGAVKPLSSGGKAPYTYSLSTGSCNTVPCTNLCPGLYTIYTTDSIGCSSFNVFSISSSPNNLTAAVSVTNASCGTCANGLLSTNPGGGTAPYSYTWSPTGGNAALAGSLTPGCYTVTMKDAMNCVLSSNACVGFLTDINSANPNEAELFVFPNPAAENITVQYQGVNFSLSLYNNLGQEVMTMHAENTVNLNTSSLARGIYLMSVRIGNTILHKKVVLE